MKAISSRDMYDKKIKEGLSVVMFTAGWCPDCVVIKPVLPDIEVKFPQFTFYSADRDELIDLCADLDIFGIPSFIAYSKGEEIARFVSKDRKTEQEIVEFLEEALQKQ